MKLKINKVKKISLQTACAGLLLLSCPITGSEEELAVPSSALPAESHNINFEDVPLVEFIRFVSKISEMNFIYDHRDMEFNVRFSTGKPANTQEVLRAFVQMLRVYGFAVTADGNYYIIHRSDESSGDVNGEKKKISSSNLTASLDTLLKGKSSGMQFFVYKIRYHQGSEIEEALKKIATDLLSRPDNPQKLLNAIQTIQWVKATNSLLCSGDEETLASLKNLIESLDVPSRQVFIEVLVIETDVRKSMDFGLQWAAGGVYKNRVGFGTGNFPASGSSFGETVQGLVPGSVPSGLSQIPIGSGFDLGVIGDIIWHKGQSFLSLGSLVHALQLDGDSTIVLNQKIITQDNKNSTIFVGDNIPYTGSVVSTVGQSQQTTANIEYRDIGVSLSITPMLGEGDIITLDIDEQITETHDNTPSSDTMVNGIRTTKTNMVTHVHVPDKHFLVLSGMIRNTKSHSRSGIPCLGGLPIIGAAFSRNLKNDEKRNVIIFVRPMIVRSFEDYDQITEKQEELFKSEAESKAFKAGVDLVKPSS